jgi:hypothetical protein
MIPDQSTGSSRMPLTYALHRRARFARSNSYVLSQSIRQVSALNARSLNEELDTAILGTDYSWPGRSPTFCLRRPRRLRISRGHHRIHLVDLPELACDLFIAGCIKEVAENRLSFRVHVGGFTVPLQRSKFINRVLLGHGMPDFRFKRNSQVNLPSFRLDTNCVLAAGYHIGQTLPLFPSSIDV